MNFKILWLSMKKVVNENSPRINKITFKQIWNCICPLRSPNSITENLLQWKRYLSLGWTRITIKQHSFIEDIITCNVISSGKLKWLKLRVLLTPYLFKRQFYLNDEACEYFGLTIIKNFASCWKSALWFNFYLIYLRMLFE